MVRGDLRVVPCVGFDAWIGTVHYPAQFGIDVFDRCQHIGCVGMLGFRQIGAIRAWIGSQFVGFIKCLADVQHIFGTVAEFVGRQEGNVRQRESQRLVCFLASCLYSAMMPGLPVLAPVKKQKGQRYLELQDQ